MFVVVEHLVLLHMRELMRDDMHEAVFDVRIYPGGGTERLEADLHAGCGASDAHGLAAADGDRHRREFRLGIKLGQLVERGHKPLARVREHRRAAFGVRVNLRTLGQRVGDARAGDVAQFRQRVQPVRTRIEVVVLELIGRRMTTRRIIDLVEEGDIVDLDRGPSRRRRGAEKRRQSQSTRNVRNPSHVPSGVQPCIISR